MNDKSSWKVKCTLVTGQKGTARPYEKYGDKLVCVRYRYDKNGFRIKTVEIIEDMVKIR